MGERFEALAETCAEIRESVRGLQRQQAAAAVPDPA